jgi:hypothetical protein
MRFLLSVVMVLVAVTTSFAQQALTVTVTGQCSAVIEIPATSKPDSRSWNFEALVNGNFQARDGSAPYRVTATGPASAAAYEVTARWTRSGSAAVPVPGGYRVSCFLPSVVPLPVPCIGSWTERTQLPPPLCTASGTRTVTYRETYRITQKDEHGGVTCSFKDGDTREQSVVESCTYVPPPVEPPPTTKKTWGIFDPATLGTCSLATHEKYVVPSPFPEDPYQYRTWHPQNDSSGCVFGHEHGMDPSTIRNAEIAAVPVKFGFIGRRHPMPGEPDGHEEPHEGFKVFIANPGDVNDEGRVNRVFSRSVFHMGTGGPKRFTTQHHSAEIRVIHPEFGLKAFTQLMMDTGGTGLVCDPRVQAPVKDVIGLNFVIQCGKKLPSGYEIWSTQASVKNSSGREVYRSFATPAVFDPITVFNPANPTELVYAWDARVKAIQQFPENDWSGNRGCDRESYAQPGYWYNGGGPVTYVTDAMGNPVASTDPKALVQEISASNSVGSPATIDGLQQFKLRVFGLCKPGLGLKN